MSIEIGGRASKLGSDYERLWAIRLALAAVEGRLRSLLWEPIGDDERGVDIWVTENDGHRVAYQLKRENRNKEYWSVGDLRDVGVLQGAKTHLERDATAEYVFVSSCGARNLSDLAERSRRDRRGASFFVEHHVNTEKSRRRDFKILMKVWCLDPDDHEDVDTAVGLLQRMTFRTVGRTAFERRDVEHVAALQIDGDPARTVDTIRRFLENNFGKEFQGDELRRCLQEEGLRFRQLAGDPSIPPAVERMQKRFSRGIEPHLIAGVSIPRPETAQVLEQLRNAEPPRLIFLHGSAGSGKSVVLHQIFTDLRNCSVPVLPIQLHTIRPEGSADSFGRIKCGLPASPALSLLALANRRRAVLIFDQMDALRYTTADSREAWATFVELVDDALTGEELTLVVACRSFDLENDPNISAWQRSIRRDGMGVVTVSVGDLAEDAVNKLLTRFGGPLESFSDRQRQLLKHPHTLALWWALVESDGRVQDLKSGTELMRRFLAMRRKELSQDHAISPSELERVQSMLVRYLDEHGRLDAPGALVVSFPVVVDALCSAGLLRRDGERLSFVHQSYFDHLVAEQVLIKATRDGRDPIEWVRANQSLFRRDQLRQLLTLLRDSDPDRHATVLRSLVLAEDVRFHLKHLVLGLLHQADRPLDHEVALVVELADQRFWWGHILTYVFWQRSQWFDALLECGALSRWLADEGAGQRIQEVLRFLASVVGERGERVDELLKSHVAAGGVWAERLRQVLPFDPTDDSPALAEFRLRQVRSGELPLSDVFLEKLADLAPERATRLVGAAIFQWIERMRSYRTTPDGDVPGFPLRYERRERRISNAARSSGCLGWELFSDPLRKIAQCRLRDSLDHDADSELGQIDPQTDYVLSQARNTLELLLAASVAGMATSAPDHTVDLLDSLTAEGLQGLERAIVRGLSSGHLSLADRAITWLCERSSRFSLGDGYDELYWEPARALIEHFAPHCSDDVYDRLESMILIHHEERERDSFRHCVQQVREGCFERNDWGRAQNVLLGALPADRMSAAARARAANWRAKFGDPSEERPRGLQPAGSLVIGPIRANKVGCLSNREWLRIIDEPWPTGAKARWRQRASGGYTETSLERFAEAFGCAARHDPQRIATLALRIPSDANSVYFETVLRALARVKPPGQDTNWEPASVEQIEAIIDHVGDCADEGFARSVCWAVRQRDDGLWSARTLDRISGYADHPQPAPAEFTVHRRTGEENDMVPDVAGTAISCVRGTAAGAIAALLARQPEATDHLLPAAQRLLTDPHPSVRYEALGVCGPIWKRDRDLAVRLALLGCEHEDERVLGSPGLGALIGCARYSHLCEITPIIERMADATEDRIAEEGAAWATLCWLDNGALPPLADRCRSGSIAQRRGVAEVARRYFACGDSPERAAEILTGSFDDPERTVRDQAAGVFRESDVCGMPESATLALRFVRSKSFCDDPGSLFHVLKEYGGDLLAYSDVILHSADMLAGSLAESTRDRPWGIGLSGNELSILLLRLYEHAYESPDNVLQEACLDRWDDLLKSRVGMTEDHLRLLDELPHAV